MKTHLASVREFIQTGELLEAITLLLEITRETNSRFHKEIILHSANLQQILKEERLGFVSPTITKREKNRITLALLDVLDEIEREKRYKVSFSNNIGTELGNMLKVFICHSSNDKPKVRQLYDQLKLEKGIDPWLDVDKLLPGVDWDFEIRSAVKASHVVLVCLSKNSVNKEGYIQKEIRQALDVADEKPDGTIFIIPLRLEDCKVPERLKRWQWLDLFEKDAYNSLLSSLRRRAIDLATKNSGA